MNTQLHPSIQTPSARGDNPHPVLPRRGGRNAGFETVENVHSGIGRSFPARWFMHAATRVCGVLILFLIATARPALSQSKPEETKTPALKEFTNSLGMKFVLIPAGEFMMGDDEWDNNKPHQVRITKPFYMQAMLVTQSQFAKVMGKNPSNHKDGDETKLPVDSISWNTAQEFVKKLNADPEEQRAGRTYRLPTDAEREYSCRAGTKTKFWYGNEPDPKKMNFVGSGIGKPSPVDAYPPNPWGLHDMHGNLYQACEDAYDKLFAQTGPKDDPLNKEGEFRVMRGGGFGDIPRRCQAAFRGREATLAPPGLARSYFGLRVACNVPAAK